MPSVDVLENLIDKCIEMYDLDPAHFYTSAGLAWFAALKMTKIQLELLTNVCILLLLEKGIKGGIIHSIFCYTKVNNKYMKKTQ